MFSAIWDSISAQSAYYNCIKISFDMIIFLTKKNEHFEEKGYLSYQKSYFFVNLNFFIKFSDRILQHTLGFYNLGHFTVKFL